MSAMSKFRKFQKMLGKKEPEKPATPEEIQQLKLDYQRELLKAGIAQEKANRPKTGFAKFRESLKKSGTQSTKTKSQLRKEERQKKKDHDAYLKRIKDGLHV